jgi:hypothetical protein
MISIISKTQYNSRTLQSSCLQSRGFKSISKEKPQSNAIKAPLNPDPILRPAGAGHTATHVSLRRLAARIHWYTAGTRHVHMIVRACRCYGTTQTPRFDHQ